MNKPLFYSLTGIMTGVIITGIVLGSLLLSNKNNFSTEITLDDKGSAEGEWNVNLDGIYPGKFIAYELKFSNDLPSDLNVNFSFEKTGDIALSEYLDLKVLYNNKDVVKEGKLNSFFENTEVKFVTKESMNTFTFKYTMPESVSNVAQNKEANFKINFSINLIE